MNEFVIKNGFISQGTSYVSDGNLGVGVTSPTSRLEVKGIDSSSSNYGLKVQNSGGTDNLVVRNDGNVGIGTSTPTSRLHIVGPNSSSPTALFESKATTDTSYTVRAIATTTNTQSNVGLYSYVSGGFANLGLWVEEGISCFGPFNSDSKVYIRGIDSSSSNYALKVENSGSTSLLSVRNGGNVGIGTSTPSETLEVNGKTKTTNFQMTSGGTTDYILTSSDSQGNGKWTPSYNLSTKDYGSFYDTTTQTGGTSTTQAFQFNSTATTKNISITNLTGITITHTGVYNIQFSAQLYEIIGAPSNVFIWLRKNGADVLNSNGRVVVGNNNTYVIAAWNYVEEFQLGDIINLMWSSDSDEVSILYEPTPLVGPAIPSVILTITQI